MTDFASGPRTPSTPGTYRVPRSQIDNLYDPAELLPGVRVGTAVVTSIDGVDVCTVAFEDEDISGVVFQGDPPSVGDVVEVELRGDLFVIASVADLSVTEITTDGAAHIVASDDPGKPDPYEINIGGSMRDVGSWSFVPPDDASWQRELSDDGTGLRVHQVAPATPVTLWSALPFDVSSSDVLTVTTLASLLAGTPTVQVVLCYDATENGTALPGGDVEVVAYGAAVAATTAGAIVSQAITVPVTITAATSGVTPPRIARLGFKLTGPTGAADLVLSGSSIVNSPSSWPVGSVWFDPDAQVAAATTVQGGPQNSGLTDLPNAGVFTRCPGFNKIIVTAPPDVPGVVLAMAFGSLAQAPTNNVYVDFGFATDIVGGPVLPFIRLAQSTAQTIGLAFTGFVPLQAGQSAEIYAVYKYQSTPGANHYSIRNPQVQAVFLPNAVVAGTTPADPLVRYFDGDVWVPQTTEAAAFDLTQDSTVVPPAKTATASTATRSPANGQVGDRITITDTTTPAAAKGTVLFYKSPNPGGPWTQIGSAQLPAGSNQVTKVWTSTVGTWWFKTQYQGSSTHQASSGVTGAATTIGKPPSQAVTKTKTVQAAWVQAYQGSGGQITGSGRDNAVHQGYYSGTYGNRKSLIRFNPGLPADAQVTKVELTCTDWEHWYQNSGGTLVLGWHEATAAPANWTGANPHPDQSRHQVDEGKWTVNPSGWLNDVITRAAFAGLTVGPGPSNASDYYGYSNQPGANFFKITITYKTNT